MERGENPVPRATVDIDPLSWVGQERARRAGLAVLVWGNDHQKRMLRHGDKGFKKYIERGLEAPCYGPRAARASVLEPYTAYLTERVAAFPAVFIIT